jgi:hypothetical protein
LPGILDQEDFGIACQIAQHQLALAWVLAEVAQIVDAPTVHGIGPFGARLAVANTAEAVALRGAEDFPQPFEEQPGGRLHVTDWLVGQFAPETQECLAFAFRNPH